MNILITGGYGFIGSFIAERFYKENHSIYIIDNLSTGKKENVKFKHKFLIANIEDERCEAFFKSHNIDVVIHCAAQTYVKRSIEEPIKDTSSNIMGLVNILHLSKQYNVKKFVFCSSAAIYGDNQSLPLTEDLEGDPISPYGINKWTGELYCNKWDELYGVSTLIFRFSNVYGPRQHVSEESSVITYFTKQILAGQPITVHGDGEQTRDFIYVGDVAEAIYRGVISELSGVYNLSTGLEVTINQLIEEFSQHSEIKGIEHIDARPGDIRRSTLDNSKLKKDLDWVPKYYLAEGLTKVIDFYQAQPAQSIEATKGKEKKKANQKIPFLSFIENLILFAIFCVASYFITPYVDTVDLWLIYILLSAILFEKTQIIFSVIFAIAVHVYLMASQGKIWTSIFVDNSLLATFTIYLLVGLIVSYKLERGRIEFEFTKDELASTQNKYEFLSTIHKDTLQVKEELKEQILRTEDSIGTIFQAIKELDKLEPEALFNGAIHVLEKTLKSKRFAIYFVNSNGYMRLAVKSSDPSFQPSASLKREKNDLIDKAILHQEIYYNRSLEIDAPLFVSPIVQNEQTIAVIICYEVEFQRLNLSYQNLVEVVSRLITSSLARANEYIHEINHERYMEGTNALKPVYFQRILENKYETMDELGIPFVMLEVQTIDYSAENLQKISALLRINDHLGFSEQDKLFILLSNTDVQDAKFVIERFKLQGIKVIVHDKEEQILHVN
ncbi:NAD-dependent epimerase/dehydratase family protein [Metabacillus sp. 22489]|uniref:NAD-dependent epimerase/dehydratase family protein n=1 Tax=Metabacillus sp. 22489 TaxID=3453928 RepID=UPI003F869E83